MRLGLSHLRCGNCGWFGNPRAQRVAFWSTFSLLIVVVAVQVGASLFGLRLSLEPEIWLGAGVGIGIVIQIVGTRASRCPRCSSRDLRRSRQPETADPTHSPLSSSPISPPDGLATRSVAGAGELPVSVRDASGEPLTSEASFCAPPPVEIGAICVAASTQTRRGMSPRGVLILAVFVGGVLGVAGAAAGVWIDGWIVGLGLGALLLVASFGAVVAIAAPAHGCFYVGREGYVRFRSTFRGTREVERLLFADAPSVRLSLIEPDLDTDGLRSVQFRHVWYDVDGRQLLELKAREGEDAPLQRAAAVLAAYNAWWLPRLREAMQTQEGTTFRLGDQTLRLRSVTPSSLGCQGMERQITEVSADAERYEELRLRYNANGIPGELTLPAHAVDNLDCLIALTRSDRLAQ